MGRIDVGLKCIQLRSLIEKREYQEAYEVAEKINLDKVTSIVDLKVIASVYERLGKYEEAKDVLLRSYEKKPTKMVIYRLAYLCVKTNEFEDAEFFYQEFSNMAPNSPDRYILRYGIDRAKGVDYLLRIATLQKLKQIDYMEEWGYELAKVYHKAGLYEECIQECNDLITWFGDGIIVEKAQMLRQFHEEGKESLDPYGVFDEGLSKEELEMRREQFIADTQDLRSQAMMLAEQQKQQEVYRQLDRDLEKTVDLRQVLAEEGEDMDLLKQAIHRSWGQPASNEYETINVKKIYAEQENNLHSYDGKMYETQGNMYEFVPVQTPEEVIAASLAEVLTEDELGQDDWNGYMAGGQVADASFTGTEEYRQEFATDGYVLQGNEQPVYSKDDFSSMMEQVESEDSEEASSQEAMSGAYLEEGTKQDVLGELSQEEMYRKDFQEGLEEGVEEVTQEYLEERVGNEIGEELVQEVAEVGGGYEVAEEAPKESVEVSAEDEAVGNGLQEVVDEFAEGEKEALQENSLSAENKERSNENTSNHKETNTSETENTLEQTDGKDKNDIELFEDETEIPAYVHRNGKEKKSIRKQKKNKKKVSKKKQQGQQKIEEKTSKQGQHMEQKAEKDVVKEKQQVEHKEEKKAEKQKQQVEQKAEEETLKQKQQVEHKEEEEVAKQIRTIEQKANEKTEKQTQTTEQKVDEKAVKQKKQTEQKEDKKKEKKKRRGFLFPWRKKKENKVASSMDVESIGKELDLLIEEVNQREEAEREEFNTLPPEALQEREPVKKKVVTEDISDMDPESMIGIGDSVGEPYIAKTKKEDVASEQEAMPETSMGAGEYAEMSEATGECVSESYIVNGTDSTEPAQTEEMQAEDLDSNRPETKQQEVPEVVMQEEEMPQEELQDDFMFISGVDLWNYFAAYQHDTHLCEDIQMAIEGIKSGKRSMHMIITCKEQERASQMGRDMAKAMKALGFVDKQQVARVTAEKLNRMHLEKNYDKLAGGFLLVEDAKKMTADTAQSIMNMINEVGNQIVVILTDARPYMNDLMNEYKIMHRYFPNDLKMK